MDRNGFLNITRAVSLAMYDVIEMRRVKKDWALAATPIIFPESKCPYCRTIVRSQYVWVFTGERLAKLVGLFIPEAGKPIRLVKAMHPHDTGGGNICLGSHESGPQLLAHGPNLRDLPLGRARTALWANKYWGPHYCLELEKELITEDEHYGTHYARELIKP